MDSSPSKLAQQLPAAGTPKSLAPSSSSHSQKPSLLPAFGEDSFSSSPFPRPGSSKRKFDDDSPSFAKQLKYYPTPVPTSSTGFLNFSSPPHLRPVLQRAVSALSERTPLGAVPTVDLPVNGELLRMGRSSNSADYQLSTNRLISRVHVQAAYHAPDSTYLRGHIDVECLGWNGAKIHCGGRVFELAKGDTYVSENPETEIMLDVQDTRVVIAWPVIPVSKFSWESEEDDMPTPTRRNTQGAFDSSPPVAPRSPVSQSPMRQPLFDALGPNGPVGGVHVFEDADVQDEGSTLLDTEKTFIRPTVSPIGSSQEIAAKDKGPKPTSASSFAEDDYSDNDEENDPVVHSFGPFGQNLLSGLESFSTATPSLGNTPLYPRKPLASPSKRSSLEAVCFNESPIKNHVINQLAYSRVHSHPLSTIHSNLPAELKACYSKNKSAEDTAQRSGSTTPLPELSQCDLRKILEQTSCVGEIPRTGKDAAGKPLETEYYYVPEMDPDQMRRETITAGMRSTGLRSVRKTHKQYYWKKPRV